MKYNEINTSIYNEPYRRLTIATHYGHDTYKEYHVWTDDSQKALNLIKNKIIDELVYATIRNQIHLMSPENIKEYRDDLGKGITVEIKAFNEMFIEEEDE